MNDIYIYNNGELEIQAGDFKTGNAENQHVFLLLKLKPGQLKQHPNTGVGLEDVILDNELLYWEHRIRKQLEDDSLNVKELSFKNGKLIIDASY
jgi:hypothetical protein